MCLTSYNLHWPFVVVWPLQLLKLPKPGTSYFEWQRLSAWLAHGSHLQSSNFERLGHSDALSVLGSRRALFLNTCFYCDSAALPMSLKIMRSLQVQICLV